MGFIIWLTLCILVAVFANNRGRSALGWGLLSVIITPIISGIILACIADLTVQEDISKVKAEQQQLKDRVVYNEKMTDYRLSKAESDISKLQNDNSGSVNNITDERSLKYIENGLKKCPECGQLIKAEAIKCKHCGKMLNEIDMVECPFCKELINKGDAVCRHCGSELISDQRVQDNIQGEDNEN